LTKLVIRNKDDVWMIIPVVVPMQMRDRKAWPPPTGDNLVDLVLVQGLGDLLSAVILKCHCCGKQALERRLPPSDPSDPNYIPIGPRRLPHPWIRRVHLHNM
jgi:hypothetical protein